MAKTAFEYVVENGVTKVTKVGGREDFSVSEMKLFKDVNEKNIAELVEKASKTNESMNAILPGLYGIRVAMKVANNNKIVHNVYHLVKTPKTNALVWTKSVLEYHSFSVNINKAVQYSLFDRVDESNNLWEKLALGVTLEFDPSVDLTEKKEAIKSQESYELGA